jgi:Ca2+-dependent lipid-binding protein
VSGASFFWFSAHLSIVVQNAHDIQWHSGLLHGKNPNLYVKIYVDGKEIGRTRAIKKTIAPEWNEDFQMRALS